MNSLQKTPDQQIDELVEILKVKILPQTHTQQEAEEVKRKLDSVGDELKSISAIVNDKNVYKAIIYKILSQLR